jgi:hypothetical protein
LASQSQSAQNALREHSLDLKPISNDMSRLSALLEAEITGNGTAALTRWLDDLE